MASGILSNMQGNISRALNVRLLRDSMQVNWGMLLGGKHQVKVLRYSIPAKSVLQMVILHWYN